MIEAIIEYLPINPKEGARGGTWQLFGVEYDEYRNNNYYEEIRRVLLDSRGIYIFYDSMGRAIYVGKTEKQTLWQEAIGAFNRPRDEHQTMFLVNHPHNNVKKIIRNRQIVRTPFILFHVARYFSAYKVAEEQISSMEAFLIRAFANNLLNKKIEKFKLTIEE
jgi:hypothetical protein